MASSRCCRRRRRCEQPPPPARDWAALPRDILFVVFLALGPREIMRGAELTCTSWRRAALGEPALWRRVDMRTVWRWSRGWRAMLRAAAERGAGRCVAFTGPCDNHSLLDLVERTPTLKSLDLFDYAASNEVLIEAIRRLPLLEYLEISPSYSCSHDSRKLFLPVCQACPRLKKLVLGFQMLCWKTRTAVPVFNDDLEIHSGGERAVPMMHELRYLELFNCELTPKALVAILDNCPLLESLHITGSFMYARMSKDVPVKCARVRNLTLPDHDQLMTQM